MLLWSLVNEKVKHLLFMVAPFNREQQILEMQRVLQQPGALEGTPTSM